MKQRAHQKAERETEIQQRRSVKELSRLLSKQIETERDELGAERIRFKKKAQETRTKLNAEPEELQRARWQFERQQEAVQEAFANKIKIESQKLKNEKKQIRKQREKLKAESMKLEDNRSEFEHQRQVKEEEMIRNQIDAQSALQREQEKLKAEVQRLKQRQLYLEQAEHELRESVSENATINVVENDRLENQTEESLKCERQKLGIVGSQEMSVLSPHDIASQSVSEVEPKDLVLEETESKKFDVLYENMDYDKVNVKTEVRQILKAEIKELIHNELELFKKTEREHGVILQNVVKDTQQEVQCSLKV